MTPLHGIDGRQDLPLPFELVVAGAAVALVVSFLVLGLTRRTAPTTRPGIPLGAAFKRLVDSPTLVWTVRAVGLLVAGFMVAALLFGQDLFTNPFFGFLYVWVWVGLVPVSLVFGPVWPLLNPLRSLFLLSCRALRLNPDEGIRPLPGWVGCWPAVVGLFAFVWLELVAPDRATVPTVLFWVTLYVVVMMLGSAVFGQSWISAADPFENYALTIARLSPWGRRADQQLVLRSPLVNLAALQPRPGLVAFVAVLIGSTGYDGFSNSNVWLQWSQDSPLSGVPAGTLGLLTFTAAVYLTYLGACWAAARIGGVPARGLPGLFVHTLVPIALGYVTAHYLTLLILEGQRVWLNASDPFSRGWDLFGTQDQRVDTTIVNYPGLVGILQCAAIIAGHIAAVIAAHDRALTGFPRRTAVTSQIPMLVVMVLYTVAALLLLFSE